MSGVSAPGGLAGAGGGEGVVARRPLWRALIKLARPKQWSKGVFCLIGPAYGWAEFHEGGMTTGEALISIALCLVSFSLASSACYVINDLMDRDADRLHPRKRTRPIACGEVSRNQALVYFVVLLALSGVAALALPGDERWLVLGAVALYVVNVNAYSLAVKHYAIADVMSLAMGFVLRVVVGCAAVGIEPSLWLLNVTFFLSMFLAFGKRLGERRTMARESGDGGDDDGEMAAKHRKVQGEYSDEFLRMAVTVTGVTTLVTYAFYLQAKPVETLGLGSWVVWLTMLPSTYGLLRAIVLVERGLYDDPTELAYKDRPFQVSALLFAGLSALVLITTETGAALGGG